MVYVIVIVTTAHFLMKGKTPYFYLCGGVEKNPQVHLSV